VDDGQRRSDIAAGLAEVRARIESARAAAGREDAVDLVVVTKTFPASDVMILAGLGVTDVAENRDQEARAKRAEVDASAGGSGLRWHMIGQLQRKKAGSVAQWADVVESLDRPELIPALARAAVAHGRDVDVLVQVALDPVYRPERGGADPATVIELAAHVDAAAALRLSGLMGVAPWPGDPDEAFERLKGLAQQVRERWPAARTVSAGMSGDLEQAIAHGATQVRVGGAILGPRVLVQ
jgi:pyridoxal phosphate enzyme (YggS family)